MLKKSVLSVFVLLAFLSAVGTAAAQQDPAGRPPQDPSGRPARGGGGRQVQSLWIFSETNPDKPPLAANPTEQKVLGLIEELARDDKSNLMVPLEDGRLLRMLTESIGARNVVEIGTYNGYSTLWFCLALRTTGGRITTHELSAKYAALARENFKKAGVEDLVTLVEGDAHETVTRLKDPIDLLFIDADKPGYADYLKKLLPLVRPGGFIIAHNTTNTARQMPDYFTAVTADPNLETIFLGQQSVGIGITLKKRPVK